MQLLCRVLLTIESSKWSRKISKREEKTYKKKQEFKNYKKMMYNFFTTFSHFNTVRNYTFLINVLIEHFYTYHLSIFSLYTSETDKN